jgi:hypothetical protein
MSCVTRQTNNCLVASKLTEPKKKAGKLSIRILNYASLELILNTESNYFCLNHLHLSYFYY